MILLFLELILAMDDNGLCLTPDLFFDRLEWVLSSLPYDDVPWFDALRISLDALPTFVLLNEFSVYLNEVRSASRLSYLFP